jgi:hypothetical protein
MKLYEIAKESKQPPVKKAASPQEQAKQRLLKKLAEPEVMDVFKRLKDK